MGMIRATHTGSLIRPPELLSFLAAGERGESYDEDAYAETLRGAVHDVVNRQIDVGIDIVDDGEMGKASWITYLYERVSGLEARVMTLEGASMMPPSRDRQEFPGAYAALDALDEAAVRESNRAADSSGHEAEPAANQAIEWVCTGPITYDRAALDRDIANLRAALEGHDDVEAFMPVVAPASAYWLRNEHYASEEEFVYGLADALREEYRAIVDAGFLLQVDDAVLMHEWDSMLSRGQTDGDYRRCASMRSTTRSRVSRRSASATTCAGEAGTAPTPTTRRCETRST
jgi:5-methyltetrahydropteroyltriglutamate--homocysteine methyltransferase